MRSLFHSNSGLIITVVAIVLFCILEFVNATESTTTSSSESFDIVGFNSKKNQLNRKNHQQQLEGSDTDDEGDDDILDYKQIKVTQKSGNKTKPDVQMQNQDYPLVPLAIVEYNNDAFQAESPSSLARMTKLPEIRCAHHGHKTVCLGSRNGLNIRIIYLEKGAKGKKYIVYVKVSGYKCKLDYSQVAIIAANTCTKYKIVPCGTTKRKSKTCHNVRGFSGTKGTDAEVPVHFEKTCGENQLFWCNLKNVENATSFYFQNECSSCFGFQLTMIKRKQRGSSSKCTSAATPSIAIQPLLLLICCFIVGSLVVL